jgi:soluble lytic murein transglycosylase
MCGASREMMYVAVMLRLSLLLVAALLVGGAWRARAVANDAPGAAVLLSSRLEDSLVAKASQAIADGRPWQATNLLAPALADSARRTPRLVLLAATAASKWEGWDQVDRLLANEPWLDTLYEGRGRALLARAALESGEDSLALEYSRQAVASAVSPADRGARTVQLGRAFERLEQPDSARAAYERSAELLPLVHDWLLLRAARATADSVHRTQYFAAIQNPVARARVKRVDVVAREQAGDLAGAAQEYAALGDRPMALRLRLVLATDSAERAAIRHELIDLLESRRGSASDAWDAIALLDSAFTPLTAREELIVARRAAVVGPIARAAAGFSRSLGEDVTARDRYRYATVLARLGRDRDAAREFARVTAPRSLAASAAYQRARSILQGGDREGARSALRAILHTYRSDVSAASSALYLLADLATDEGRDAAARDAFRTIVRRYPTSDWAATAAFRAGLIAFITGNPATAARELDALRKRHPRGEEALAATYWSGRAWSKAGNSARARARWRAVADAEPLSYYAMLSSHRLGEPAWTPPAAVDSFPTNPQVDSTMARAAALRQLGLNDAADLEYEQLEEDADQSLDRLLATAVAFRSAGLASRAIRLGWRALDHGAPRTAAVYRFIYPVSNDDRLTAESDAHGLDRALVAALVRQESLFQPHATSGAGARGLMQVMPSVGRDIAETLDYPFWESVLLYQPDVNLQIGCTHLAEMLRQYDTPERALAAYNAGGSRVDLWSTKRGTDDPEVFVERIPFSETRDYVRIIERNREMYRGIYEWGGDGVGQ